MNVELTPEELELIELALRELKIDLSGYGLTTRPEDVERLLAKLETIETPDYSPANDKDSGAS
jgi:hypothetical protein